MPTSKREKQTVVPSGDDFRLIKPMLMRYDCVGDDSHGDDAKAWSLLLKRFQSVNTPTVVNLVAQLDRLPPEVIEDHDSLFLRGQRLLTMLEEAGEIILETFSIDLVLNSLPLRYEN